MRKKIFFIFTILWMGFIFYMSHQPVDVSVSQSDAVIEVLSKVSTTENAIKDMKKSGIEEFIVRKGAHMFLYATLGVLIFISIYDKGKSRLRIAMISFVLTVIYACTDEFHQLFVQGRTGQLKDVGIDSLGALLSITLATIIASFSK